MKYDNIIVGSFIKRPNRFIAHVKLGEEERICHVKNTGRCKELFIPGVPAGVVFCGQHPHRKTQYDLVSVKKQGRWVNIDSQMANHAAEEWLKTGALFSQDAYFKREVAYGNSRFDFYIEDKKRKVFLEVKGVTLEENGIARFPDAPTLRGVKHIEELIHCMEDGYEAYLLLIIQMKGVSEWRPNWKTHREFGRTLLKAKNKGLHILAKDCQVEAGMIKVDQPVKVVLEEETEEGS